MATPPRRPNPSGPPSPEVLAQMQVDQLRSISTSLTVIARTLESLNAAIQTIAQKARF